MKKAPCIRFGMRIRPKISEKPDDSRNSKPPSAMLFTASVSQRLMDSLSPPAGRGAGGGGGTRRGGAAHPPPRRGGGGGGGRGGGSRATRAGASGCPSP